LSWRALAASCTSLQRWRVNAGFCDKNGASSSALGVVKIKADKALFCGLLEVFHQTLVAGVVRDHQLKIGVRLNQFTALVQRQLTPMVGQG
jgi:hypothetical protein